VLGGDSPQAFEVGRTFWRGGGLMGGRRLTHLIEHPFVSRRSGSDEEEEPRVGGIEPERVRCSGRCEAEATFHEAGFAVAQNEGDLARSDVEAFILVFVTM
jgi:hypothetical protein